MNYRRLLYIVMNWPGSTDGMIGSSLPRSPPVSSILLHQGCTYANPLDSMMLINSLLSHATDTYWDEFTLAIERLNVPDAVVRLASSYILEDLTSPILDFQANVVRVVYRLRTTAVDPKVPEVQEVLNTIWGV